MVHIPATIRVKDNLLILLAFSGLVISMYFSISGNKFNIPEPINTEQNEAPFLFMPEDPVQYGVDDIVTRAQAFKSLLNSTQIATLQQTYTTTLARKWSNLPCGSGCRNGIQFSTLNSTQLGAALNVIAAALNNVANEGYAEFDAIRKADAYLKSIGGGSGYDSTIYFIAFLNEPSYNGGWMLQFGGHHYAANIAFNNGRIVGTTPHFMGLEPLNFTMGGVTYAPLAQEHDSMSAMLASLTSTELATAKLNTTFSDCYMSPGETNGGNGTFPATKVGLKASNLTASQKSKIVAAIRNYTIDIIDSAGSILQAIYESEIDDTYIAWTGSGTAGNASNFLNANSNYVRIDGPSVWIELICQNGAVIPQQIHYHTVYRDHFRDYGLDLTRTTLPLSLLNFDAIINGKGRLLTWRTANEKSVSFFEVERSLQPNDGFNSIAKIAADNNAGNEYRTEDNTYLENSKVVYYRLKMVFENGAVRYSNIVALKYTNSQTGMAVYPNPVSKQLTIAMPSPVNNALIRIIDASGATVASYSRSGQTLMLDVSGLAKGVYFLEVSSDGKTSSLKFVR